MNQQVGFSISVRAADILRWITIGQSGLSGLLVLGLAVYAALYFYHGRAWRRFTFIITFAPSFSAMFAYIAVDLHSRIGAAIAWHTWAGLAIFTLADYSMLVLLGHLMVKRDRIHDEIRHYTIVHDPGIESRRP